MKRKSKQRSKNRLNFQQLEQRQLLAADVIGQHQVNGGDDAFLPALIVNGDFETANTDDGIFVANEQVAGWTNLGGDTQEIYSYNGYDNILDLDSTSSVQDVVFQSVVTQEGTDYLLLFDYRGNAARTGAESESSFDFDVRIDGVSAATFTGGDIWATGVVPISGNALNSTRLAFGEVLGSGGNDGIGALLDNIRLVDATEVSITNGSFEDFDDSGNADQTLFENSEVPGWTAAHDDIDDVPERLINIESPFRLDPLAGGGVSLPVVGVAADGISYVDLDVRDNRRDSLHTTVDTIEGARYFLTFYARNDGLGGDTDELRVRWNDAWATTILPGNEWQQYSLFLKADSDRTQIDFLEVGDGDGSGPHIDGIQLHVHNGASESFDLTLAAEASSQTYTPGIGAMPIGADIGLQGQVIESATVTLSGNVDGNQELIAFGTFIVQPVVGFPNISISDYDPSTGQVVLSGTAPASFYQTRLNSLSYFNGAHGDATAATRQVELVVTDASGQSQSATIELGFETDQAVIDDAILTKFIADNDLNAQQVREGLYVVIDEPGTGLSPTINNNVRVAYNGVFVEVNDDNEIVEGESFDSSSDAGITFPLSGVIPGWIFGIPEFRTGGSGKLLISSDLAYGTRGQGSIPPNTVLVFDIDLLEII